MNTLIIAEIQRALLNIVKIGVVSAVDAIHAKARVQMDALETAWLPWCASAGALRAWNVPKIGEQVLVISTAGDLAQGIIVGGIFQRSMPAPTADSALHMLRFDDGAVLAYNARSHALTASLPSGGTVSVMADGGVNIQGDLNVNGRITSTGDTIAAGISIMQHRHGGVMPGGAQTGSPV